MLLLQGQSYDAAADAGGQGARASSDSLRQWSKIWGSMVVCAMQQLQMLVDKEQRDAVVTWVSGPRSSAS